jgi:hypothetical protein
MDRRMSGIIIPAGFGANARESERTIEPMSREAAMRLGAASDVIQAMGLQLVCPKCTQRFGPPHDGVKGDNPPGSDVLDVTCNCTIRRYRYGR